MDLTSITPTRKLVANLTALGVPVPRGVAEALKVHDACSGYTGPPAVDLDAEALTVTAAGVAKLIERAAETEPKRPVAEQAQRHLLDRLSRRCIRSVAASAEEITANLAPIFTDAAEAFTDAYRQLPTGWQDAELLVRAGAGAVATLQTAQEHVAQLDACRYIRKRLHNIEPTTSIGRGTLYCEVENTMVAEECHLIRDAGNLGYFGNLIAVPGVIRLRWWATPADHKTYLTTLPAKTEQWVHGRDESGFIGSRKVSAR
jgi:hypothetical protein